MESLGLDIASQRGELRKSLMARVFWGEGLIEGDSLAAYLGEALPERTCFVVADVEIMGCRLDVVLVNPRCILILKPLDWAAVARPVLSQTSAKPVYVEEDELLRRWQLLLNEHKLMDGASSKGTVSVSARGINQSPRVIEHSMSIEGLSQEWEIVVRENDLQASARPAVEAIHRFLREEFPSLSVKVGCLHVVRQRNGKEELWQVIDAEGLRSETLAETIMSAEWLGETPVTDLESYETLAEALSQGRLGATQRASKPFVFRSGRPFRVGTKVWTLRDAVYHMDRYPQEGILHLRDGTLAKWFTEIGAPHYAELVREALAEARTDDRAALELFLMRSGHISRPKLRWYPKVLDLGYLVQGETGTGRLEIRRSRGYLFGKARSPQPWLRAEPDVFRGSPADLLISVSTRTLLIRPDSYVIHVQIVEGAAGETSSVPVRFRVVALPSGQVRWLLRPLIGVLVAGLMGGIVGQAWTFTAAGVPLAYFTHLGFAGTVPMASALIMAIWGLMGLLWSLTLPAVWPVRYSLRRWLIRIAGWTLILVALMAGALVLRLQVGAGISVQWLPLLLMATVYAMGGAIVPATIGEILVARRARSSSVQRGRPTLGRVIIGILIVLLVGGGLILLSRALNVQWTDMDIQSWIAVATAWGEAAWQRLNELVAQAMDWLYLEYFRRAGSSGNPSILLSH